jgi:homopolymeric O-antigen transport system ATP-binding protein
MSDMVIKVEDLGKRYVLGERELYRNLGESISRAATRPFKRGDSTNGRRRRDQVWALKNVSFEVNHGEVIGIIGPNGAGKSTLLKILSRVTRPTTGSARLRGRVAALLEVGTGFHLDLTGRDNVYLNGVVLGMSRREVDRKFDEIVEFAGVERFLDTPVKRYSSGMIVRLGFAVAAHLEPEILIVDEVLAVGDAEFQRKCLGKMDAVAREGRTVLFVSHNMNAVQRLCPESIALKLGEVARTGPTRDVVAWYLADAAPARPRDGWVEAGPLPRQAGSQEIRVVAVACSSDDESIDFQPYPDGPLRVKLLLEADEARSVGSVAITLRDQLGTKLINADSITVGRSVDVGTGRTEVTIDIQTLHLSPGTYVLGWWIADPAGVVYDWVERAIHLEVIDITQPGLGMRPTSDGLVTTDFKISARPV